MREESVGQLVQEVSVGQISVGCKRMLGNYYGRGVGAISAGGV